MVRTNVDAAELEREVVSECIDEVREIWDENRMFQNPAKHAKFGMHSTWHMNLVPDDVMTLIASHETVAKGIVTAAEATLENWANHRYSEGLDKSPEKMDRYFLGIVQELTQRDGKGAIGEAYAREMVDFSGEIVRLFKDDEQNGIDIRVKVDDNEYVTYQVKTGETFKSGWDKKEANHMVWVKTQNDEIVGYEIDP